MKQIEARNCLKFTLSENNQEPDWVTVWIVFQVRSPTCKSSKDCPRQEKFLMSLKFGYPHFCKEGFHTTFIGERYFKRWIWKKFTKEIKQNCSVQRASTHMTLLGSKCWSRENKLQKNSSSHSEKLKLCRNAGPSSLAPTLANWN